MVKPEPHVIKAIANAVRQYPELLVWLEGIFAYDMKRLPYAVENSAVFQGRCQMLCELIEFVKQAPTLAAKL